MADYRLPQYQIPRKPMGASHAGLEFHSSNSPNPLLHTQHQGTLSYSLNRTRASSNSSTSALPYLGTHQHYTHSPPPAMLPGPANRQPIRRLSSGTNSTSSTSGNLPTYTMSNASSDIRRSSSSRSGHVRLGYVALMRRQKATVWCDRAQPEDPRLIAQRQDAKQRAYLELNGSASGGRTGTLGTGGRIRHPGSKGIISFPPSTLVGATVPPRLSAREVGDDNEDDHSSEGHHRRTNSGRSSTNSIGQLHGSHKRQQQANAPLGELVDTPDVVTTRTSTDYEAGNGEHMPKSSATMLDNETEEENRFGGVSDMDAPSSAAAVAAKAQKAEELRRRGSVDDRSTRMIAGTLYVANPDIAD